MGELGIAPRHAPLITRLKPGQVRVIQANGEEQFFYISGGILEVQPQVVTVLADTAMRAKDLDEVAAMKAKAEAERVARQPHRRDGSRRGAGAARAGRRAAAGARAPAQEPQALTCAAHHAPRTLLQERRFAARSDVSGPDRALKLPRSRPRRVRPSRQQHRASPAPATALRFVAASIRELRARRPSSACSMAPATTAACTTCCPRARRTTARAASTVLRTMSSYALSCTRPSAGAPRRRPSRTSSSSRARRAARGSACFCSSFDTCRKNLQHQRRRCAPGSCSNASMSSKRCFQMLLVDERRRQVLARQVSRGARARRALPRSTSG